MKPINILQHENTRLVGQNQQFSLYLFSGNIKEDLKVVFKSDQLAIFVCLAGKLVSSTKTLSYHLSENLISFALSHDCKKVIPKSNLTEFLILTFSKETLEELIHDTGEDVHLTMSHFTSCQCTVNNCNSEILTLARKLLKEGTEKYWGFKMNSELIFKELLVSFVRLFTAEKQEAGSDTVALAKEILESSTNKELSLDSLAETCGVSSSHLCRIFKKATGRTISQYFNALKVDLACKLLAESNLSIEEVAFESGFNNPSYFFRVFKKQTGKLPLDWRRNFSVASKN